MPPIFGVVGAVFSVAGVVFLTLHRPLARLAQRWEIPVMGWPGGEPTRGLFLLLGSGYLLVGGAFTLLVLTHPA